MKKIENFLLGILRTVDGMKDGIISYCYKDSDMKCYCICLNCYDLYTSDKRFKALSEAWHKAANSLGIKIAFFYCTAIEEKLAKLLEQDNLLFHLMK